MQIKFVRSMGLPKGVPVEQFTTVDEVMAHLKGNEARLVDICNLYGQQKDALVEARDYLSEALETEVGFKVPTHKEEVNGKSTDVYDWTESEHIQNFVAAVSTGKFTPKGVTLSGTEEQREAQAYAFLQSLVERPGKFTIDLTKSARVGKARKLPEYAVTGAQSIIAKGSEAKWAKRFTEGFTNEAGIKVPPIAFQPFDLKAAKGAKPEEVEAVKAENQRNLALAIVTYEAKVRELVAPQKQYV